MAKTVDEIAKDLGVSITTVRAVLNGNAGKYRISLATQEKINQYVKQHSYTINLTARSLKLNKSNIFGLVIPRLSNPFFSALAEQLEASCRELGYQLMISCSNGDAHYENLLVKSLEERNVDGIFIAATEAACQAHHLKHRKKALVFLDRDFAIKNATCVTTDNSDSGYRLTRAMLEYTSKSIYFFVADPSSPTIIDRLSGFHRAMAEQGITVPDTDITYAEHNRISDGASLMAQFIDRHQCWPQNFIASSLPVLQGALSVLRERYGYIPNDINIGTFDDNIMLSFLANNIWSMRQNEKQLVEKACQLMIGKLEGSVSKSSATAKAELIFRQRKSG
ncbi:LacI family DNA-binding transcriptional regulator [Ewingella sp. S1.OA.A_B6]